MKLSRKYGKVKRGSNVEDSHEKKDSEVSEVERGTRMNEDDGNFEVAEVAAWRSIVS